VGDQHLTETPGPRRGVVRGPTCFLGMPRPGPWPARHSRRIAAQVRRSAAAGVWCTSATPLPAQGFATDTAPQRLFARMRRGRVAALHCVNHHGRHTVTISWPQGSLGKCHRLIGGLRLGRLSPRAWREPGSVRAGEATAFLQMGRPFRNRCRASSSARRLAQIPMRIGQAPAGHRTASRPQTARNSPLESARPAGGAARPASFSG